VSFIRFVVSQRDEESGYRQGFIHATDELERRKVLSPREAKQLTDVLKWFKQNLPVPDRFTRTRNANHKKKRALSWFKESASVQLQRAHELIVLMDEHGIFVETIRTSRPGYIVYEDEFQVVAEPFSDTPT
jgi:LPS O-antigen subunit length determinant protein (WzzB/FepE family)